MSIGAKDRIDQLLVKKYSKEQVDNHDYGVASIVAPEKMMEIMNDYAAVQRNMLALSGRLSSMCEKVKAKARYTTPCFSR